MRTILKFRPFVNEMFDMDYLKDRMINPYKNGDLLHYFVNDLGDVPDKFVENLSWSCPFIQKMKYTRSSNFISIGDVKILFDNTLIYFSIETNDVSPFKLEITARTVSNRKVLYEKKFKENNIENFNKLISLMNDGGYKILMDLNNFTTTEFGESISNHYTFDDNPINIRSN